MHIDKYIAANICNDLENIEDYSIIGEEVYYKEEMIGKIKVDYIKNVLDIKFLPIKKVEYITINVVISKT